MEPLEFTTTRKPTPQRHTIDVTLLGDHYRFDRPKDWILQHADTVADEDNTIPNLQRAVAILQFLNPTLGEDGMEHFLQRAVDHTDPLDLAATRDLIIGLKHRWDDWDHAPLEPLVITTEEPPTYRRPIPFTLDEHPYTAHPPKELVIALLNACRKAPEAAQQWAMELFLESTLTADQATHLRARLNQPTHIDDFDLPDLDPVVAAVIDRWSTEDAPLNRAERRALTSR